MSSRRRGFTLVEVMIVVAIMSLVAALSTVGILRHRQNAEDLKMQAQLSTIYQAMEGYRQVYGRYPRNYGELQQFVTIPDFNQRYEVNPNP